MHRFERSPAGAGATAPKALRRLVLALAAAVVAAASGVAPSPASQLIARGAAQVRLQVDRRGEALVSYAAAGRRWHVLAWGAIGARPPGGSRPQVRFHLDYAGGWGKYGRSIAVGFADACRPYSSPPLAWLVTACTAPDGTFWALQRFPQPLPDLGFAPWLAGQRTSWLELSHWRGPLPRLEVHAGWVYGGRFQRLFGRFTYLGRPVYGLASTRRGAPADRFGRLLYLDTFDSVYGAGWRRENSLLAHAPTGGFCYGLFPHDPTRGGYLHPPGYAGGLRGPGTGAAYRITARGPGVTPDVVWQGPGLRAFDPSSRADVVYRAQSDRLLRQLLGPDPACHT